MLPHCVVNPRPVAGYQHTTHLCFWLSMRRLLLYLKQSSRLPWVRTFPSFLQDWAAHLEKWTILQHICYAAKLCRAEVYRGGDRAVCVYLHQWYCNPSKQSATPHLRNGQNGREVWGSGGKVVVLFFLFILVFPSFSCRVWKQICSII